MQQDSQETFKTCPRVYLVKIFYLDLILILVDVTQTAKKPAETLLPRCSLSLSFAVRPPLHFLSPRFPFWFLSAISFFHFVFLYLYLLCFLCLSPSLRGWCDEWDECKHMCGVYDGLLTGRSYLLCSAPVVL